MSRHKPALAGVLALAIVAGLMLIVAGPALAVAPPSPWPNPDPNSLGRVILYNASGNPVTSGTNLNHLADYAAGTTTATTAQGNRATLYFDQPDCSSTTNANATDAWQESTAQSTTNTFPNTTAGIPANLASPFAKPMTPIAASLGSLNAAIAQFGPSSGACAGYYQVRIYTTGVGQPGSRPQYWESVIFTSGGTATQPANWSMTDPDFVTTTTTISTTPSNGGNTTSGNDVTMTATVTPAASANGIVQFFDGTTLVGTANLPNGASNTTAVVSTAPNHPADGVHNYTAHFLPTGGTAVLASTSSISSVSVGPPAVPTQTALGVNPNTAPQGTDVTLTATVTAGNPAGSVTPPSGSVQFFDGASPLGSPVSTDTPAGSHVYQLVVNQSGSPMSSGVHSITATFTPTGNFTPSTSAAMDLTITGTPACQQPGSSCTDVQDIQVTVGAGTITISTPYTPTNRYNLGTMTLNADGTQLSASGSFPNAVDNPIRIISTLSGNPGWTASVTASDLNTSPANATPISGAGLGLTAITNTAFPTGKTAASTTDIPANSPGLAGGPHTFAQKASDGNGTWDFRGTLTLLAPSSTLAGTYFGTITFTVV